MRATFITTALDNGASLEDVQRDVGHGPTEHHQALRPAGGTTEKSASFFGQLLTDVNRKVGSTQLKNDATNVH